MQTTNQSTVIAPALGSTTLNEVSLLTGAARARRLGSLGVLASAAVVAANLAAIFVLGAGVAAGATLGPVSPYGEVGRFGGFAEGAVAGKFDYPVGFAVDSNDSSTTDHNAVYVLDRVVNDLSGRHLRYRLQKLSSTGAVLGSVLLPEQTYTDSEHLSDAHPMFALTVDSAKHRVYALVESLIEPIETRSERHTTVVQQLVAWSTEPKKNGSGEEELVPAEEAPGKPYPPALEGKAALITGALQSTEPAKDLAIPEGLAINPTSHAVIIEAQNGATSLTGGPTALWSVETEGTTKGALSPPWTAETLAAPETAKGTGVFTTTTGTYGIDLNETEKNGHISLLATVNNGLTAASRLAEDKSNGANPDQAPTIDTTLTANSNSGNGISDVRTLYPFTAGSPITQLTNELYAARYGRYIEGAVPPDQQAQESWAGTPVFWWDGGLLSDHQVVNVGIRLFNTQGHVVTTIGGQPEGHPCNLNSEQMSLAAGANETLFVLTEPDEENVINTSPKEYSGDQVIEFAPGATGACPVPSITQVTVTQNGKAAATGKHGEPVIYQGGASVKFEVTGLERKGETPFAFAWNVTGGPSSSFTLFSEINAADGYHWPSPAVEYEYKQGELGLHEGTVRLEGDYGTITFPFKVLVLGTEKPKAEFSVPATVVEGQAAEFNGSASKPTPGSSIEVLRWEFSDDGSRAEDAPPQESQSHTFAKAGMYTVKLTIFDEAGKEATTEKPVTVLPASAGCEPNCTTTTTTTTTSSPPPTSTTTTTTTSSTIATTSTTTSTAGTHRPPTKAELLASALKACKKIKKKKQRTACEAQAKRKYAAKSSTKKHNKKHK
jgi:hypothetical protein